MCPDLDDDLSARIACAAHADQAAVERVVARAMNGRPRTARSTRLLLLAALASLTVAVGAGLWWASAPRHQGRTSARMVASPSPAELGVTSASIVGSRHDVVRITSGTGASAIVSLPGAPTLAPVGAVIVIAAEESK